MGDFNKKNLQINDTEKISCVFHNPVNTSRPKGNVVFCHGFYSNKEGSYKRRARKCTKRGFKSVRFDFRGVNESSREFRKTNLSTRIEDLKRVLDELDGFIGVYGSSFGGLVSIHSSIQDNRINSLCLRAPVTYLKSLKILEKIKQEGEYEGSPGKTVDKEFLKDIKKYETKRIAKKLDVPTFIMHGHKDKVVPEKYSKKFFQDIDVRKKYKVFESERHIFTKESDNKAIMKGLDWFEKFC